MAVLAGDITAAQAEEPEEPFSESFEDQSPLEDFTEAANEAAEALTRKEFAEQRVEEICNGFDYTYLSDASTDISDATGDQINDLFLAAVEAGYDEDVETFEEELRAEWAETDFTGIGTTETVTDIPADFCEAGVYDDLLQAQMDLGQLGEDTLCLEWLSEYEYEAPEEDDEEEDLCPLWTMIVVAETEANEDDFATIGTELGAYNSQENFDLAEADGAFTEADVSLPDGLPPKPEDCDADGDIQAAFEESAEALHENQEFQ